MVFGDQIYQIFVWRSKFKKSIFVKISESQFLTKFWSFEIEINQILVVESQDFDHFLTKNFRKSNFWHNFGLWRSNLSNFGCWGQFFCQNFKKSIFRQNNLSKFWFEGQKNSKNRFFFKILVFLRSKFWSSKSTCQKIHFMVKIWVVWDQNLSNFIFFCKNVRKSKFIKFWVFWTQNLGFLWVEIAVKTIPAKSSTIAADVDAARLEVKVNGDETVDVTVAAHQFEIAHQTFVILHQTQNITYKKQNKNKI